MSKIRSKLRGEAADKTQGVGKQVSKQVGKSTTWVVDRVFLSLPLRLYLRGARDWREKGITKATVSREMAKRLVAVINGKG